MRADFEKSGLYPLDITWDNERTDEWLIRDVATLQNWRIPDYILTKTARHNPAEVAILAESVLPMLPLARRLRSFKDIPGDVLLEVFWRAYRSTDAANRKSLDWAESNVLTTAFLWEDSPEGEEFWDIWDSILREWRPTSSYVLPPKSPGV